MKLHVFHYWHNSNYQILGKLFYLFSLSQSYKIPFYIDDLTWAVWWLETNYIVAKKIFENLSGFSISRHFLSDKSSVKKGKYIKQNLTVFVALQTQSKTCFTIWFIFMVTIEGRQMKVLKKIHYTSLYQNFPKYLQECTFLSRGQR